MLVFTCICVHLSIIRYPVVRLAVSASPLQLQLSPYRYQQLMMVLQSIAPATTDTAAPAEAEGPTATADKPLWMSEAEYMTKVSTARRAQPSQRPAIWGAIQCELADVFGDLDP